MKGEELVKIASVVYGIRWLESLAQEFEVSEEEIQSWSKLETLPATAAYALRRIAEKYTARYESMRLHKKISDHLLNGLVDNKEQAAFMAGMEKGMSLVLSAIHGEPWDLKDLAKENDLKEKVKTYMDGGH